MTITGDKAVTKNRKYQDPQRGYRRSTRRAGAMDLLDESAPEPTAGLASLMAEDLQPSLVADVMPPSVEVVSPLAALKSLAVVPVADATVTGDSVPQSQLPEQPTPPQAASTPTAAPGTAAAATPESDAAKGAKQHPKWRGLASVLAWLRKPE